MSQKTDEQQPTTFRQDSFSGNSNRTNSDLPVGRPIQIYSNPFSQNFGRPVFVGIPVMDPSLNNSNNQQPPAFLGPSQQFQQPFPMMGGGVSFSPSGSGNSSYQGYNQAFLEQSHKLQLEHILRRNSKGFVCLNLCFGFFAIVYIVRIAGFYGDAFSDSGSDSNNSNNNSVRIAAILYIVMYAVWLICTALSVWAIANFRPLILRAYIMFMILCLVLEVAASIALFTGFGSWQTADKSYQVLSFILTSICQIIFVLQAKQIQNQMHQYKERYLDRLAAGI